MDAFDYIRADDVAAAVRAGRAPAARYIGGGTNLLDLMKSGVEHAGTLVDITRLRLDAIEPRAALADYDAGMINSALFAVTVEQAGGSPDGKPHSAPVFTGKLIETVPAAAPPR